MSKKNLYKHLLWITTMAVTCFGIIGIGVKPLEVHAEENKNTMNIRAILTGEKSGETGEESEHEVPGELEEPGTLSMEIKFNDLSYIYDLTTGNWTNAPDKGSFVVIDTSSNTDKIEGYETATLSFSYTPIENFKEIAVGTIKQSEDIIENDDSPFLKDHKTGITYTLELENKMENKKQANDIVIQNLNRDEYSTIGTITCTCSMKCDISVDNGKEEEDGE